MSTKRTFHFETMQLHVGQEKPDIATDARCVPIYQTSSYVFSDCNQAARRFGLSESGNIYTRLMNPTSDVFEQRIAALEGGAAALATASGSAAISYAIQNIAHAGDHIVAASTIYGGTFNLLSHTLLEFGIETTFVDGSDVNQFRKAIRPETKAIFLETLGNPACNIIDMDEVARIAHENQILLIVDNTFATPYLFRPIEHGADVVVHSATKFIGGHGTSIGGVIIDAGTFDFAASGKYPCLSSPDPSYHGVIFTEAAKALAYITRIRVVLMRDMGASISPFNSFLFLQGLETLSLRVERHVENALKTVQFLNQHPKVARVDHPSLESHKDHHLYQRYFPHGGGSVFTFDIKGTDQDAKRFIDRLQIFSLLANVADVKSLVIHPASTTHSQMSAQELSACKIWPETIRLSIGTEHIDDILWDISQALEGI